MSSTATPFAVGALAPAFTLKTKTETGLADVALTRSVGKGPTVLLFIPLAFTGACTKQFCTLQDSIAAYHSLGADVIGISVDSPFALEAWAKAEGIRFTLVSDFNKEASAAYGVLNPAFFPGKLDYAGVSDRAVFVIGRDGRVKYNWVHRADPTVLPPMDEVRAALATA